jgi:carboxypeptidase family protein
MGTVGGRTLTPVAVLAVFLIAPHAILAAQPLSSLHITVLDPSDAVIVGARVNIASAGAATSVAAATGARGDAHFSGLEPGRYSIHVESPGFEPADVRDVRVRGADTSRTVKLSIAKVSERVDVGRDPRERASDARGDLFATVLGQAEINELPDDPDELEQVLRDMAGPGAVLRVNGFRGGRLPPKDQIAQIRFHRNMFAADVHEPGFLSVDIVTKPGLDAWRGSSAFGFRDAGLNARNAFAPVRGDERHERAGFSLTGPLWKKHTSVSLTLDGIDAFDTKTIVAALPSGYFADSVRKPTDTFNGSARVEHAVAPAQQLRVEAQRNHTVSDNLGVGDFDLADRAYRQTRTEEVLRGSLAGSIRKALYNELRAQWRTDRTSIGPASQAPATIVLNAFSSGGAQIDGGVGSTTVEVADDLDIASGRHALRTGFLLEAGRYDTDQRRNAAGTFTFADLAAYTAARPTTFTRNVGDPRVDVFQAQAGSYVQDDYRASTSLTMSGGVRAEVQSRIGGIHLGPRGGLTWAPFKSGRTTVRAGGGLFFDWLDAQTAEQAIQLDGRHQQIETIVQPGYPDATEGGGARLLPNGRVVLAPDLAQPALREASAGVEQQIGRSVRLNVTTIHRRGSHALRGINLNAPAPDGTRPDPTAGPVTEIRSAASSAFDALSVNLNVVRPDRRIFVAANYLLSRSINETDSPFAVAADARDLGAERGPAATDARHRVIGFANVPLVSRLTLGTSFRVQSALPFDITTGRDDNGDTISSDRPAGVTRNTGRGRALVDVGARLTWRFGFGGSAPGAPGVPQVRVLRPGADANPLADLPGGDNSKRYGVDVYVQTFNALNHLNAVNFSGVMTSPFFGRATSAAPPRRLEIGARLSF